MGGQVVERSPGTPPPHRPDAGFSLVELLVASALTFFVVATLAVLTEQAGEIAHAQPEAVDVQQRARVATAALYRDLHGAGAGMDRGRLTGALSRTFPPILPRRIGAIASDAPTVARADVISMLWVPGGGVQAAVAAPFSASPLVVADVPGCPAGVGACGVKPGMGVLVFDPDGHVDLFTAQAVSGASVTVRHRGGGVRHLYTDRSVIAEFTGRTYYLDRAAKQLRQYDTDQTDVPVLDEVTAMTVEYFGDAAPPAEPRPLPGDSNCLFGPGGDLVPGLAVLTPGPDGLAHLPLAMLGDGPWCGSGDTAFDADLLRVRRVRIALRVQASSAPLRGSDGRFASAGTSRHTLRAVPDVLVAFDVAPRNLDPRNGP
jgi:hypothetical protein